MVRRMSRLGMEVAANIGLYAKTFVAALEAFTDAGLDRETALSEARMVAHLAISPEFRIAQSLDAKVAES